MAAVLRTGRGEFIPELTPEVIDDVVSEGGYQGEDADDLRSIVDRLALRSAISVPLIKHGRILGGLSFVNTTRRRAFTEDDRALAEVIAGRVASSLENRRLSDQQHRIASTLQASLLPRELPQVPGLDVAVRYWAAGEGSEVGGDFYDLFDVDDHTWVAVIGDVCGTGPDAAALTAIARHNVRQAAWRGDPSLTVLHWLNRAVRAAIRPGESFLTTALVKLQPRAEGGFDIEITNAGHPPAVLVRADGRAEAVGAHGALIGVLEQVKAQPTPDRLLPGDTLVMYTDGLTDVPPPHDLSPEQTLELLATCCVGAADADAIARRLEAAVTERLRIQHRPDDIALLILHAT
jgi:serine phosphatase RsbU (regulator of sigma subunit)